MKRKRKKRKEKKKREKKERKKKAYPDIPLKTAIALKIPKVKNERVNTTSTGSCCLKERERERVTQF